MKQQHRASKNAKKSWEPVASLILGILAILMIFGGGAIEKGALLGIAVGVTAIILGIPARKYQNKGKAIAGIVTGSIAIFLSVLVLVVTSSYESIKSNADRTSSDNLSSELQSQADSLKSQLPKKTSEATTTTDVTVDGNVVTFHVSMVSDVDESTLDNTVLKDPMIGPLCNDSSSRSLLDAGATYKYIYTHAGSGNAYTAAITSYDC